ncbi:MAG: nitroreductase family deazaflavin-dependent oxidoreductase [Acidimicrobiia bacterium]|jgi:deazaflavin-dependent oxidoreductase (nitroreductase family)
MWRWIIYGLGGIVVMGLALWALLVVSMRTKFSPVLDGVRRMNRTFMNPRALKAAGRAGATYSVIRHRGRTSSREYETPVGVVATDDGFVIGLPYGPTADWVKNTLAAGSAIVVDGGAPHVVTDPEVVHAPEVDRYFSARERLVFRLYGVREFLVMRLEESPARVTGAG